MICCVWYMICGFCAIKIVFCAITMVFGSIILVYGAINLASGAIVLVLGAIIMVSGAEGGGAPGPGAQPCDPALQASSPGSGVRWGLVYTTLRVKPCFSIFSC